MLPAKYYPMRKQGGSIAPKKMGVFSDAAWKSLACASG